MPEPPPVTTANLPSKESTPWHLLPAGGAAAHGLVTGW